MPRRAFTLVELLVSITVLLVILTATARIFSTASKVAGLGEANANLQTTSIVIERLVRGDLERLNRTGYMAIQCIAVRNDVNRVLYSDRTVPLLDPSRDPSEYLRCDQIVFFTDRQTPTAQYQPPGGAGNTGLNDGYGYGILVKPAQGDNSPIQLTPESSSWTSMMRLGIGVQMPLLQTDNTKSEVPQYFPDPLSMKKIGALLDGTPLTPWTFTRPVDGPKLEVSYFNIAAPNNLLGYASQPEARRWTLARQSTLMADDGGRRKDASGNAAEGALYHHGQFAQRTVGSISMSMRPNAAPSVFQIGPSDRSLPTPKEVDAAAMLSDGSFRTAVGDTKLMPNRWIVNSRVDIASCTLRDLLTLLRTRPLADGDVAWLSELDPAATTTPPNTPSLRQRIASACFGGSSQGTATQSNEGLWGFPRSERVAPSMSRGDAMLVAPTLAGNCSSFQIDWTWRPGTGAARGPEGSPLIAAVSVPNRSGGVNRFVDMPMPGLITTKYPASPKPPVTGRPRGGGTSGVPATENPLVNNPTQRIPWFGLPDTLFPASQRSGVTMLSGALPTSVAPGFAAAVVADPVLPTPISVLDPSKAAVVGPWEASPDTVPSPPTKAVAGDLKVFAVAAPPIDVARIEGSRGLLRPLGATVPVFVYQAIFGPNGSSPFTDMTRMTRDETYSAREARNDFTPWPTALRFTMTLHDQNLELTAGRTFQFVVDLPNAPK